MCNLRLPIGDLQFWPEGFGPVWGLTSLSISGQPNERLLLFCYLLAISDIRVRDGTAETAVAQTNNQSGSASISRSPLPSFPSLPLNISLAMPILIIIIIRIRIRIHSKINPILC